MKYPEKKHLFFCGNDMVKCESDFDLKQKHASS